MENMSKKIFLCEEHLAFHITEFRNLFLTVWGSALSIKLALSACTTIHDRQKIWLRKLLQ